MITEARRFYVSALIDGDTRLRAMGRLQSRFAARHAACCAVIAGTPCE